MQRIKVTHYNQDPAHCAVASSAVVANYYNSEIDYEYTKELAHERVSKAISEEGLDSAQICLLLNYLGFNKITLVTSDLTVWDYSWKKFSHKKLVETLKESLLKKDIKEEKEVTKTMIKWMSLKNSKSDVKIDYDYGKYIKSALNKNKPVILTFNWTMYFKFEKEGKNGGDAFNGEGEEHAVVANGYDKNGVWVVDSHHNCYKYSRKKYKKGFYKIKWEHLFACMGQGDVIIPEKYIG
jgi:hypothetical protein